MEHSWLFPAKECGSQKLHLAGRKQNLYWWQAYSSCSKFCVPLYRYIRSRCPNFPCSRILVSRIFFWICFRSRHSGTFRGYNQFRHAIAYSLDRNLRDVPWKVGIFGNFLWDRKGIPRRKDATFYTKTGNIRGQALNLEKWSGHANQLILRKKRSN